MIKYLVIGDPVAHSRSPNMQNAAFEKCGLGRPYGIRHVLRSELPEFFEYARRNLCGVNLTVPHKLDAVKLSDELTPRAAAAGSVNTLIISDGHILGDSTDGIGLERALEYNFNTSAAGRKFIFFGAGGAARATSLHLACAGADKVTFVNRTPAKADELSSLIALHAPSCRTAVILPGDRESIADAIADADFLIQTTSLGLLDTDLPPFDLELLAGSRKIRVFDTIYRKTPLLQKAETLQLPFAGGKEMLVQQGAASFEAWTGIPAPVDAMREGFELPPGGVEA